VPQSPELTHASFLRESEPRAPRAPRQRFRRRQSLSRPHQPRQAPRVFWLVSPESLHMRFPELEPRRESRPLANNGSLTSPPSDTDSGERIAILAAFSQPE